MKALLWNSVWRPGWRGGAAPSWVRRWQMDRRESTDGTETETESEERWENKTPNGKLTLKSEIQILNLIRCEMEAALRVISALTSRSYLAHWKETGRRFVCTAPPAGPVLDRVCLVACPASLRVNASVCRTWTLCLSLSFFPPQCVWRVAMKDVVSSWSGAGQASKVLRSYARPAGGALLLRRQRLCPFIKSVK